MILTDSSVWIDYFNGNQTWQTNKLDFLLSDELIITGDIILTEILQGFRNDLDFRIAKKALNSLPCYTLCGKEIALKSANNFRVLRKRGVTIRKTIDMIIGTFCIENGFILLHDDKDFLPLIELLQLKVLQPA